MISDPKDFVEKEFHLNTDQSEGKLTQEQDSFPNVNGNDTNKSNKKKNRNKKSGNKDKNSDKCEPNLKTVMAYKYSNKGRGNLHEAIIINGKPYFVTYDSINQKIEIKEDIPESTRILRPPNQEEYPYTPYEFENKDELIQLMNAAKEIKSLDPLYNTAKEIFSKYVDQDIYTLTMLPVDCIWTYFQDLFPITHYSEGIGDNDVGKSSIGYTFEYTGYRVVKGTSISGANYYRLFGFIEPGQCTIVEDEGDSISDDPDKIRNLKAGYEYTTKIPKINMNTVDQAQKWYYGYCYKMILAEKSMSQLKAKGLVDRTFTFFCRPGKVRYSIKEVVSDNINKSPKLQSLYKELLNFRKLMLCYRLVHYRDILPQITINLKNRDNELCKPLLQLFYGTDAFDQITKALEFFVMQRRERRSNSIEAALYPILKQFIYPNMAATFMNNSTDSKLMTNFIAIPFSDIWTYIINNGIAGKYDERKPKQYETFDYGILYQNTLSKLIADKFGAKLDRKSHGSILIFNRERFDYFEEVYSKKSNAVENANDGEDYVKIEVKLEDSGEEKEGDVDNVGNEGSGICVGPDSNFHSGSNELSEDSAKDPSSFTDKRLNEKESNTKDKTHSLKPTQPTQPTLNEHSKNEDFEQLPKTVSRTGTTFYHCPQCNFENIHQDEILHHIKYTHNNPERSE
jgi:hypothetical protein